MMLRRQSDSAVTATGKGALCKRHKWKCLLRSGKEKLIMLDSHSICFAQELAEVLNCHRIICLTVKQLQMVFWNSQISG
ncbi:hypothetical protein XELAEV_18007475mg [Xenopus laevis]|uniref:Uncharacterized protein n=1 Tax=Xenopus laevis TaxID=8355 RepID=A0A974E1Y4_XENLA|nr:hypothetical protein XELAEV_18007475mg [Xenopus laevis]